MNNKIVQRHRDYKINPNHMIRFLYNTITREEFCKRMKKIY